MSGIENITIEELQRLRPDLHERIFTAGKQAERERFAELQKTCGENLSLLADSFISGRESDAVVRTRLHELERQNRELRSNERFLREEYEASPALQAEFRRVDAFIAYRRQEAKEQQREADRAFDREQRGH